MISWFVLESTDDEQMVMQIESELRSNPLNEQQKTDNGQLGGTEAFEFGSDLIGEAHRDDDKGKRLKRPAGEIKDS